VTYILIVVPFLDEQDHLPQLLGSMAAQERRPDRLVLVDDGSSDASPDQAAAFAATHSWATVLRRPRRPRQRDRMVSAHELRAFQWALDQVEEPWDVAAKLDADLRATPDLVAELARRFAADPRLGIAGTRLRDQDGRRQRCPDGHVEGATSFYRRECWEAIAPLPPILGWDTIDEVRARMRGWRTESFDLPGGETVHLRPMGSHDGLLRGYRRAGLAAYSYGAHPMHVVAGAAARMRQRPRLLGGIHYLAGWTIAAVRRAPRAEPELRREVRRENIARLRSWRLGDAA
jgi:glycosyltransferase involved in cell wall biosynthesis